MYNKNMKTEIQYNYDSLITKITQLI